MKKLIVFDAYGTLFDVYSIARQAEQVFPSHGVALANLWRDKQIEYTRLISLSDPSNPLGSAHFEPFWDLTQKALAYSCARMKLTLTAQAREQLMTAYDHLSPFEENEEVLKTLKALGRQTAILSNANANMLKRVIEHAELTPYFDQVISIESVRQSKPTPGVTAWCMSVFPCSPKISCLSPATLGMPWVRLGLAGTPFGSIVKDCPLRRWDPSPLIPVRA